MTSLYLLFIFLTTGSLVLGKEKCNKPADIAFVIDSSASIWGPHFETQIKFVQDLLKDFNIGTGLDTIHVSALTFSDDVKMEYTFNDVTTVKEAVDKTGAIKHAQGQDTLTDDALRIMRTDQFSQKNGARSDVPKICILITDGASRHTSKTLEQAKLAKEDGIIINAIGIGISVNDDELEAVVSVPSTEHYFKADNFDDLKDDLELIGVMACQAIVTVAPTPTVISTTTKETTTEEQADQPKEKCQGKKADILFVVDMSSSIWPVHFKQQLEFLADLTSFFDIDSGKTRVGMLTFSNETEIQFYLDEFKSKEEIKKAILAVKIKGGLTNTHLALQTVEEEMLTKEYGSRRDVAHIVIVITDGESRQQEQTKNEAEMVHKTGVDVFAIGVGDKTNIEELKYIASKPEYVFEVDGYGALKEIGNILAVKTCEAVKPPQPAPREQKDVKPEKNEETESICRSKVQDILFVVDMSSSIWVVDFLEQLKFLSELVGFFDIDRGYTKVGMMTFSNDTEVQFYPNNYDTKEKVQKAILEVKSTGGLTNTHLALLRVLEDMITEENGFRLDVDHTCIVITDGISREPQKTKLIAEILHKTGMNVIAIGVGKDVDVVELMDIASKPELMFEVGGYDALIDIKGMLARTTCEGLRPREACEVSGIGDTTAFTAFIGAEVLVKTGDVLIFDKVIYNINAGYNPKTGIFTAQANGFYRFAFSADLFWKPSALNNVNVHLMKNNEEIVASGTIDLNKQLVQIEDVAILELEQADKVWVQVDTAEDSDGIVLEVLTTFSGVFLRK